MNQVKAKLAELGLSLPQVVPPIGAFVPALRDGDLVYTSGQVPVYNGEVKYLGSAGQELTVEQCYDAARYCVLNCLAAVESVIGDLDLVERVVRVTGYVASAEDFHQQPKVINGASDLLLALFGAAGTHVRCAVGVKALPRGVPCEVEITVRVRG